MKNKYFSGVFIIILFVMCFNSNIYSFSGWNYLDGEYCYLNNEGRKIQNVWQESEGKYYYLGNDGNMVRNTIIDYGGNLYYLNQDGAKVVNVFVDISDENHLDNSVIRNGRYYFDERGRAFRRYNNVFRKNVNGRYYAFDEDGLMLIGWLDKDGYVIDSDDAILSDGVYYARPNDGLLSSSIWYNFTNDVGSDYIDDYQSQVISDRYDYLDNLWMYFDSNCKKVYSTNNEEKIRTINGRKYAFDEKGIMVEGFTVNKAGIDEAQPSNPTMMEKVKFFDKEEGELLKNRWIRTAPSNDLSVEDYVVDEPSWYRTDSNGNIIYNKLKAIDNKKYVFDGLGRMKTGFVLIDAKSFFVASYKPEELTRDDFIYSVTEGGKLYGSDLSNLHFFGEDEVSDGSMKTGSMQIELDDGVFEFNFGEHTGVAKGAKNTLKKSKGSYYINGLKLVPIEDMKYGVVKISDEEYRVVSKTGKIIKGNRKIIKDDYGNNLVILRDKLVAVIPELDNIKLRWLKMPKNGGETGYYYYDNDIEVKQYIGIAVPLGTVCPTDDEIVNIPEEMRLNFRV